jgi:hypothetical protein
MIGMEVEILLLFATFMANNFILLSKDGEHRKMNNEPYLKEPQIKLFLQRNG